MDRQSDRVDRQREELKKNKEIIKRGLYKDIFPLLRKKAEEKGTLVEGKKKINAHLSFTLEQVKALGARREY